MADLPQILRADEIAARPFIFRHPLDENAEISLFPLSYATALKRAGVTLAHLAPGRCSYPQHAHMVEEEWIYLLSGTATLTLDTESHAMAAGDFAAFPPGGPAHKLTNTGAATLVYLMGGEVGPTDIVDFPEQGLRVTRAGGTVASAPLDAFSPFDFFARSRGSRDG